MITVDIVGDDGVGFKLNFSDEIVLDDIDRVLDIVKDRILRISNRLESLPKYEEDEKL